MANLTPGDLQTPEYQTIVDLSDTIRIGIQNDLGRIVTSTYSAGIITPDERDNVLDPQTNQASHQRARGFMTIIESKIQINPGCLVRFRGILADQPSHRSLVEMIGELFSLIQSRTLFCWT